jgi:hypothetical protein
VTFDTNNVKICLYDNSKLALDTDKYFINRVPKAMKKYIVGEFRSMVSKNYFWAALL